MNPLLFADWNYIHRVFRGAMWLLAMVLVFVIWYTVALRAPAAHSHPTAPLGTTPKHAAIANR
jgi:hypothetical protein